MRRKMSRLACVTIASLLLTGCGAKAGHESDSSAVRPKDAVSTEAAAKQEASGVRESETERETSRIRESETERETSKVREGKTEQETSVSGKSASRDSEGMTTVSAADGALISEEEAKLTALEDAGLTEEEITGIRIKLERDDGVWEYEVDFYEGNKEYDYDIDAQTGEIREKDMEIEDDFVTNSSFEPGVSEEEAVKIALERVPEASEDSLRIHLDYDDGILIYEGSIYWDGVEYEFEMDADSGMILEWEEERER